MSEDFVQQFREQQFSKIATCKRFRVTWRQLITGADWPRLPLEDGEQFPQVYAILDSADVPIYVGGSVSIYDRLMTHVGRGNFSWAQGPSAVGQYIIDMAPVSGDWGIELLCLRKNDEPWVIGLYNPWFNYAHCDASKSIKPTPAPVLDEMEVGLTEGLF